MRLSSAEISRKCLHLLALLMPAAIFYGPQLSFPKYLVAAVLGAMFFSSVIAELLRFKIPAVQKLFFAAFGSMMRHEEKVKITGSTWIIGAAFLCAILFRSHTEVSFMVLTMFVLGDAMAALVGISMGRIKIGKKSLEGSLACFVMCVALCYALFPFVPGLLDSWNGSVPIIVALTTAFVITLFELVPLRILPGLVINDNLAVPVIAGYVMIGLSKLVF